jgi:hypothetical protein
MSASDNLNAAIEAELSSTLSDLNLELTRYGGRFFTEMTKPEANHAKNTPALPTGIP